MDKETMFLNSVIKKELVILRMLNMCANFGCPFMGRSKHIGAGIFTLIM
jgi:hypothetical protein